MTMSSKKLSKTAYQNLFKEITLIYDDAMKQLGAAVDTILKKAYWEIGRRVVEIEQKGSLHAPYGSHLLEDLSRDLTETNRKGFSVTNLRNMRQVYTSFAIHQISDELTWSHYVILSSIQDKKQRQSYARKAIRKKWIVEELKEVLKKDNVSLDSLYLQETKAPGLTDKNSKDVQILRLAVKRGVLHTYRIVEPLDPMAEKDTLCVDCGFFIYYKLKIPDGLSAKPGDIITTLPSRGVYTFKRLNIKESPPRSFLYTYAADVTKITDADTLTVMADLGFGLRSKQKLRLRSINAPEVDTTQGKKAKDFVTRQLKSCGRVVIKTYSTDIFDRYLVDVFYLPNCDNPEKIAREGILLNQQLVDKGLVDLWKVVDKDDLAFLN